MKEIILANDLLAAFHSLDKAIEHVNAMLTGTNPDNIAEIDKWLDVRSILKIIA